MKAIIWILIAALTVVQQMDWDFEAQPLVAGVIPPALMLHAVLSVVASLLWLLAVTFCWPADAEVETPAETESRA